MTDGGRLKILDFGVAKLVEPLETKTEASAAPRPETDTGAVIGTVGYMSPEQVRGLPADLHYQHQGLSRRSPGRYGGSRRPSDRR